MTILKDKSLTMLLVLASGGNGNLAAANQIDNTPSPEDPVGNSSQSLCLPEEKSVFDGAVQDDLGLGISICMTLEQSGSEPLITARWFGEGGGDSISCRASECKGILEYSRYVRPRFTEIRVAWRKGGKVQRLTETFAAEREGEEPDWHISHRWHGENENIAEAESFPVQMFGEPLSLMTLGRFLPEQGWVRPLLTDRMERQP